MKVLHIMSGFGGGISSFILNKAEYFIQNNIIFDVITFDAVPKHFSQAIHATGGQIHTMTNPKVGGFKTFYKEVNQVMEKMPEDVFVHCHIRGYRAVPFYLIAKKNGLKRFGMHAHTTGLPEEINSIKNKRVRMVNNLLANEKISCGKEASRYLFGEKYVENHDIMHIPNSINPESFLTNLPVTKSSLFGKKIEGKYLIGHIGRFYSVKNHLFMLSIIELLAECSLDFLWVFIGDGKDYEKIQQAVKHRNLEEYVCFLGRRNDIPELLQVLDVFVLPSKYEGFPTVAVESQASGTKTILSNTITEDADLQLDLVEFLPITDPRIWAEYLLNNQTQVDISSQVRLNHLKKYKLTNKESAKLYEAFLKKEITHYELDAKEGES